MILTVGFGLASAERYIVKTDFEHGQPALFRASLNGQTITLHRDAAGQVDVTRFVKPGKNSLVVEVTPGSNTNGFEKSIFTLGAGNGNKWRTLYNFEVNRETRPGQMKFTFMAQPDKVSPPGKVSVFGKFSSMQPVQFTVSLNGETISTMNSNGNLDITSFLKKGKNLVNIKYVPGKNTNGFVGSTLTIGEQQGSTWNNVFNFAVNKRDKSPGTVSFPIYR